MRDLRLSKRLRGRYRPTTVEEAFTWSKASYQGLPKRFSKRKRRAIRKYSLRFVVPILISDEIYRLALTERNWLSELFIIPGVTPGNGVTINDPFGVSCKKIQD